MYLLVLAALVAQTTLRGYTTADPINADRFGVALPDGRYMVQLVEVCDISIGQNVWVSQDSADHWRLQPMDSDHECGVFVFARMDDAPCFMGDDGQCDVVGDPPVPEGY